MTLQDLAAGEEKVLQAAHEYADAVDVLCGTPPFSAEDALRIVNREK